MDRKMEVDAAIAFLTNKLRSAFFFGFDTELKYSGFFSSRSEYSETDDDDVTYEIHNVGGKQILTFLLCRFSQAKKIDILKGIKDIISAEKIVIIGTNRYIANAILERRLDRSNFAIYTRGSDECSVLHALNLAETTENKRAISSTLKGITSSETRNGRHHRRRRPVSQVLENPPIAARRRRIGGHQYFSFLQNEMVLLENEFLQSAIDESVESNLNDTWRRNRISTSEPSTSDIIEAIKPGSIQNNECTVCFEKGVVDTILIPCGHQIMCHNCSLEIKRNQNICPICRKKIVYIVRMQSNDTNIPTSNASAK